MVAMSALTHDTARQKAARDLQDNVTTRVMTMVVGKNPRQQTIRVGLACMSFVSINEYAAAMKARVEKAAEAASRAVLFLEGLGVGTPTSRG